MSPLRIGLTVLFLEELTSKLMKNLRICMRFVFRGFGKKFPPEKKKINQILCFDPDRASKRKYAIWKKHRCEKKTM